MDVGQYSRRRLYTGLGLDYILRLCAPTSASRAISAIAELLVIARCSHVFTITFCHAYNFAYHSLSVPVS